MTDIRLEIVLVDCQQDDVQEKQDKTRSLCVKSCIFSVKTFLQAKPTVPVKILASKHAYARAEKWIDAWLPRRVQIDTFWQGQSVPAETLLKATSPTAIVLVADEETLLTPDAAIVAYDSVSLSTLNTILSLMDFTPQQQSEATELRVVGARHYRSVVQLVPSIPVAARGITLGTDWNAWETPERQLAQQYLQGRFVLSPVPGLAMRTNIPPTSPCVPWDRIAQMIESQT